MKKLLLIIGLLGAASLALSSCIKDEVEDKYKDWRRANNDWFNEQMSNTSYYTTVTAPWDPNGKVLMHWYNDTMLTCANLKPLYSSTVDVKYRGMLYDATPFDSSYLNTKPALGIARLQVGSASLIEGWSLGLMQMHVGDSCRIVVPYTMGYGSYSQGKVIKPFSTLIFDIKLQDIYAYEVKP